MFFSHPPPSFPSLHINHPQSIVQPSSMIKSTRGCFRNCYSVNILVPSNITLGFKTVS